MMISSLFLALAFSAHLRGNYINADWANETIPPSAIPGNTNSQHRLTRDMLHSLWCSHESYLQHKYFGLSTNSMSAADRALIAYWNNGRASSNRFALPYSPSLGSLLGEGLAESITNIERSLHNDANPSICSVWGDAGYLLPASGSWTVATNWWAMSDAMTNDLMNAWTSNWMFWPVTCTRSWAEWMSLGPDRAYCIFDRRVINRFFNNLNIDANPMWDFETLLEDKIQERFRYQPSASLPEPPAHHYGQPRDLPYMQDIYCRLRGWPDTSAWWQDYSTLVDIETNLTAIGKALDTRRFDIDLWVNINYCIGPLHYLCQYLTPTSPYLPLTAPATWRKVTTSGSLGWNREASLFTMCALYAYWENEFDAQGNVSFTNGQAMATMDFRPAVSTNNLFVVTNTVTELKRSKVYEPGSWVVNPISMTRPVGMTPSELEMKLGGDAYSGIYTMAQYYPDAILTTGTEIGLKYIGDDMYKTNECRNAGGISFGRYESDDALTIRGGSAAHIVGDTSGIFYTQETFRVQTNALDRVRGYMLDSESFSRPRDAFPMDAWLNLQSRMNQEVDSAVSDWSGGGRVVPPSTMQLSGISRRFSAVGAADEYVTNYVSHITGPDLPGVVTIRWLRTDRDSLEKVDTPQDNGKIVDISVPYGWYCDVSCDVGGFVVGLWNGRDDPYFIGISLLFPWEDYTADEQELELPPRIEDIPGAYDSHGCTQQLETIITPAGYANMRIGEIEYKPNTHLIVNGVDYLGHPDGDFIVFGFETVSYDVYDSGGNAAGIHSSSNLLIEAEADLKGIAIINPPAGYFSLDAK